MQNQLIEKLTGLPSRLVDSALQCCFRISALRPWLMAFGLGGLSSSGWHRLLHYFEAVRWRLAIVGELSRPMRSELQIAKAVFGMTAAASFVFLGLVCMAAGLLVDLKQPQLWISRDFLCCQ